MPGSKIPILEVEKLTIKDDGRGIDYYHDGTNFLASNVWQGVCVSGANAGKGLGGAQLLCAASSSGWLRLTVVSGTAADATYYIPVFSNVNTKAST